MKGVVLAGGNATRLRPLSNVLNKHLFPVYDVPMIYCPIQTLVAGGVTDIMVILGGNSVGDIVTLLQDGSTLGAKITYRYQSGGALGIAHALGIARDFIDGDFALILGDNVFFDNISISDKTAPHLFLTRSLAPERFGVAVVDVDTGAIIRIVEKPKERISDLVVTGLYLYPKSVFSIIDDLKPSARGELEITDLNNSIGNCNYTVVDKWFDVGEYDTLHEASEVMRRERDNRSKDKTP